MSEALEESQSLLDNTLNIFAFLPVAESNPAFLVRTKTNLEHDTEQLLESDKNAANTVPRLPSSSKAHKQRTPTPFQPATTYCSSS